MEVPLVQVSLDQQQVDLMVENICRETNTKISVEQDEDNLRISIFGNRPGCNAAARHIARNLATDRKASEDKSNSSRSSETNNRCRSPIQELPTRAESIGNGSQSTSSSSSLEMQQLKKYGYALLDLLATIDLKEVELETRLLMARINAVTES